MVWGVELGSGDAIGVAVGSTVFVGRGAGVGVGVLARLTESDGSPGNWAGAR